MSKGTIYLFLGPEEGEKENQIRAIRNRLVKEDPALEIHRFYPFDTQLSEVLSVLRNTTLFSSHILVILRNIHDLKKSDFKALTAYAAKPAENTTLVLCSEEIRGDRALQKSLPAKNVRIFWELFENQKSAWISDYFRQHSMRIESGAVEMILNLVENNTRELKRECEKIALYFGSGHTLTEDEIETFIYHSREESVFSLFEALISMKFPKTLEISRKMTASGETHPVQLIAGLVWQFRNLHKAQQLRNAGESPQNAVTAAGIRGKRNQKLYMEGLRVFSCEALERTMILLTECDANLRSFRSELHPFIIDLFLYQVMKKKGVPLAVPEYGFSDHAYRL